MHEAVREYVRQFASDQPIRVLELGSRDVNGNVRDLFPAAHYHGIDRLEGPGVDEVADACHWRPDGELYDLVLCLEMLEHAWPRGPILLTARQALRPGGRLVITCAGEGRPIHSGIDGGPQLYVGEYYSNVSWYWLHSSVMALGFQNSLCSEQNCDIYLTAIRGTGESEEQAPWPALPHQAWNPYGL